MEYYNLPKECIEFLETNQDKVIDLVNDSLEVEKVLFNSVDELTRDFQIIDTHEYHLNYGEFEKDPGIQYQIPCVNLIKKDVEENYDSDGLFVWLQDLNCFGSFDIDHCIGYLFKYTSWADIERNLGNIINTQWDPETTKNILFKPWEDQGLKFVFEQYIKKSNA